MDEKVKNELQEIAFDMFRDFTKSVTEKNAAIVIHINDEGDLVNDLIDVINSAKKALNLKDLTNVDNVNDYQIGYMLGYLRSNLNTKWVYEYVIKQSNNYKEFVALKALSIYLKEDSLAQIKINSFYNHLLLNENNLYNYNQAINKIEIGINDLDMLNDNNTKNDVMQMIENKINKFVSMYLEEEQPLYVWPIVKYFSSKGILQLVATEIKGL